MPKVPKRRDDTHFAEVGDEFFLTLENEQVVVCMNRAAFAVMENLDGFTSPAQIGQAMAKAYGLKGPETTTAVERLCADLLKLKVVEEIEQGGKGRERMLNFLTVPKSDEPPRLVKSWAGAELAGGMFVSSFDGDISVIVPNVTDGPIKTCPSHTCTIPAGLFTSDWVIRTFSDTWNKAFQGYRRTGLVVFQAPEVKEGR